MEGRCSSPRLILGWLGVNDSILKFFWALFGKVNDDLNLNGEKVRDTMHRIKKYFWRYFG